MTNDALKILILDDDQGDRMLVKRALKHSWSSCECTEAASIEEALLACEKSTFDCAIVDYHLSGQDGLVGISALRVKLPYISIIMATGQGDEMVATEAMKRGASDYIPKKHMDAESIRRVIMGAMEKAALQRKVLEQQRALENFARVLVHTVQPMNQGMRETTEESLPTEALQRFIDMASEHGVLQKHVHEQRASLEIFTRALAHDLKEPVRTIRSFLDLITDWDTLSEKSQRSFHYISKAADRMNALIDAVYLYTRLDAAQQMEKSSCKIADVLEEAEENLAQLIQERSAVITHDALPAVQANRVQMIQLFQNLLANAIRHCDGAVTVHVGAQEKEDHWQLTMRDNGPGIATEYLETIFDPFKRMSQRKKDEPGLGLGLAINRKIVEYHGGKLWCESEPGAGAAFYFTLPKASISSAEVNAMAGDAPRYTNGITHIKPPIARILLVDDNEADIELNRIILVEKARLRCDVLTACSGTEAMTQLQNAVSTNNLIDLILLDINMPGMSGFELLAQIKKENMNPLVVMCTTSAYDVDMRMADTLGAAGYLTKPPQFSMLKTIIDRSRYLRVGQEGDGYALLRAA